ncbi:MAG: helix-turn-helix domain-containing protein [Nocardioides sp.]|nr:helix-turn-helix domain-containing protein [Nocardioides sp.]
MVSRTDWLTTGDRSKAAERRILTAAEQLFWQRGLRAVTVDAVARRAGCSRATLYRHVSGRQALVDATLAAGATRITRYVEEAVAAAPEDRRAFIAITTAVDAIRRDRPVRDWLARPAQGRGDDELARSRVLTDIGASLTGVNDPVAVEIIVRCVLALVLWPPSDPDTEAQIIERTLHVVLV